MNQTDPSHRANAASASGREILSLILLPFSPDARAGSTMRAIVDNIGVVPQRFYRLAQMD